MWFLLEKGLNDKYHCVLHCKEFLKKNIYIYIFCDTSTLYTVHTLYEHLQLIFIKHNVVQMGMVYSQRTEKCANNVRLIQTGHLVTCACAGL